MRSKFELLGFLSRCLLTLLFLLVYGGCSTVPLIPEVQNEEVLKRDLATGNRLGQELESQLKFKKDTEVALYLRRLTQRLVDATPELHDSPVGIWLIQRKHHKWENFSLPGNRIYLSIDLLRQLEYENEIAAAIAIQLGHVMNKDVLTRLKQMDFNPINQTFEGLLLPQPGEARQKFDFFGPNGILIFSEDQIIAAVQRGVGILYRAGYDVRGFISLCLRFQDHLEASAYEKTTLNKLIEQIRREIVSYSPLRNPIIRSKDFLFIQKRIRHL